MRNRRRPRRILGGLFVTSFVLCLWLGRVSLDTDAIRWGDAAIAEPTPTQLTQQGWDQYQRGDVRGAIDRWQAALQLTSPAPSDARATILKYLARADQQIGQVDQAIAYLNRLIDDYRQLGNTLQVGRMLAEQAQVYSSIGQHRKAIALLCSEPSPHADCSANSAIAIARAQSDTPGLIAALGSLGNAHRLSGNYHRAIQDLDATLSLATAIKHPFYIDSALTELGNTYASLVKQDNRRRQYAEQSNDTRQAQRFGQNAVRHNTIAIAYFQASLTRAQTQKNAAAELRSLLNLIVPLQRVQGSQTPDSRSQTSDTTGSLLRQFSPLTPSSRLTSLPSPPALLHQAQTQLNRLPDSREKAYAAIRLASLTQLVLTPSADLDSDPATNCFTTDIDAPVAGLLEQAVAIAHRIQDAQSEAFALGRLGHLYECHGDYKRALALTQQAQLAAANQENRYLWEWQVGRILQADGKLAQAIVAYDTAVNTLESIRGDLAIASRDFQFDFRDTVEPVYRELTALYLEQATQKSHHPDQSAANKQVRETLPIAASARSVEAALETIDRLRLAELRNYFGEDCTLETVTTKPVTLIDQKTAVLSSVLLDNWVAVILTLPTTDQGLRSQVHWLPVTSGDVSATVNDLRLKLEKRSDLANTYLSPSQQLYDWLIRPFAAALSNAQIETLVFIQDGILRSIPMAALHDGKHFLVERYAIASTLSLTLVDPTPIDRQAMRVLGFGLTQPAVVEGPTFFAPLSSVKTEIDRIVEVIPGSKGLLDQNFTVKRLEQELTQNMFPIVHLATHGRFGIDAWETFLVTGGRSLAETDTGAARWRDEGSLLPAAAVPGVALPDVPHPAANSQPAVQLPPQTYNETLTMDTLYQMIRTIRHGQPLELLTLTACETAAGSDRDALGIAGISLQAGARSTIASLWQVDDQATAELVTHFYRSLHQGMSRAKALQFAQKTWLQTHTSERRHPGYWAALILVGNWL